jgi:hypothetical protein
MAAVVSTVTDQSLNALVTGFSFASAIAWMDVARWVISTLVKVPRTSGMYSVLTALMTTLLAVIVYMVLRRVSSQVRAPQQPIYAVTA